jgi:hypothetical protein
MDTLSRHRNKFSHIHTRQAFSWDCGIACVASVCQGLGIAFAGDAILDELESKNVWTIDLLLLLHKLGVKHIQLTTLAPFANPDHATLDYYAATFKDEAQRVEKAFLLASSVALPVNAEHISMADICMKLAAGTHVYILLVDLHLLKCSRCWLKGGVLRFGYAGHYILLLGYDPGAHLVSYMDPATDTVCCYCSPEEIDAARSARGTDEDIIHIGVAVESPGATSAMLAATD